MEFNKGIEEAFKAKRLLAYALSLTRDKDDADDLVNDTMVLALDNRASFEPGSSLIGWLFRIMRNCFISKLRRERAYRNLTSGIYLSIDIEPVQEEVIRCREVVSAMAKLPKEQRRVLVDFVFGDKDVSQLSQKYGVKEGTVKSRICRSRDTLYEKTGNEGERPVSQHLKSAWQDRRNSVVKREVLKKRPTWMCRWDGSTAKIMDGDIEILKTDSAHKAWVLAKLKLTEERVN